MDDLQRNQAVCVSCGEKFVGYKGRVLSVSIKKSFFVKYFVRDLPFSKFYIYIVRIFN